jgi:hypothetical protein
LYVIKERQRLQDRGCALRVFLYIRMILNLFTSSK